ncbi:MAG TPA: helix-turn-helix transcriptional regulator [Solirubrobacteraceae bacterium]|jgi:cytoskeletal protein RodZ|nr:helix-turn-helix transcriptional regulator [Solirubrobacteraceae bacterium]
MPEIGATLREARMRARIDVSEIEATTKIRAKYLRALENEEWGLLPGPTFVKSFLRTYAQALGLDGKSLVEEYRLNEERPSDAMLEPIVSSPQHSRRRVPSGGPSRGYVAAVSAIAVVIIVLIVLLASGGSSPTRTASTTGSSSHKRAAATHHSAAVTRTAGSSGALVSLSLKPTASVFVCLLGDGGRKLVPGTILQAGESTPTFHARRFEVNLGNNAVTMYIDGRPRTVPPSSQAIGYTITKARGRQSLTAGQLPTCQ